MLERTDFSRSNTLTHSYQGPQPASLHLGSFRPTEGPTFSRSMSWAGSGDRILERSRCFLQNPRKYLYPILLHELIVYIQLQYTPPNQQVCNGKGKFLGEEHFIRHNSTNLVHLCPTISYLHPSWEHGVQCLFWAMILTSTICGGEGSLGATLPEAV